MTKLILALFCFPSASFETFSVLNNGKIHLRSEAFRSLLPHKHLITMIIEWPGIVHSCTTQKHILGSSIFMTLVQTHSPYGSTTGGHGSDVQQQFYPLKHKKVGLTGRRISLLMPIQKRFSSFVLSTLHGYSVGSTDYRIISWMHFHYLWFVSTR